MYFTLIPVAALLLMLVGVGMPAHAAVPGQTSESRMRALLGLEPEPGVDPGLDEVSPERAIQPVTQHSIAYRWQAPLAARTDFAWQANVLAQRAMAAPGAFEVKQYRTRFGVAGGAYQAAGPPAAAARARFRPVTAPSLA